MAVGDAAGKAGLVVYDDTLLVNDIDKMGNQRGDELAAALTRIKALEDATTKLPKFSVARGNGATLAHRSSTIFTGTAWATPYKMTNGFKFSGGVLTVPRAGVYSVVASMKLTDEDYYAQSISVTRNSDNPDAGSYVARAAVYPGDRGQNDDPNVSPTCLAVRLAVSLNANDQLRVVGYQRNYGGESVRVVDDPTALTFEVMWQDAQ